jgi:phage pi2 protein 07
MADHDVFFTIPERELGRAEIEFKVKRDNKAFGRLRVSNGSMVWIPADRKLGYKLKWREFADFAEKEGESGNR